MGAKQEHTATDWSTGLAYLVNARVLCKRGPSHWAITRDDVDHARRDAGLDCQLAHPQCAQWRLFCHLPYAQLQRQADCHVWKCTQARESYATEKMSFSGAR